VTNAAADNASNFEEQNTQSPEALNLSLAHYQVNSQTTLLAWYQSLGIPVCTENKIAHGAEALLEFYTQVQLKRSELPYEIDGVVYKVNSFDAQQKLGLSRVHRALPLRINFQPKKPRL